MNLPEKLALLRQSPWLSAFPENQDFTFPGSLLSMNERKMLRWLGAEAFTGIGCFVDLGAFSGSSARFFAEGLEVRKDALSRPQIHSFDLFRVSRDVDTQRILNLPEGGDFLPVFQKNTAHVAEWIQAHRADVCAVSWPADKPIEFLFIDVAKSWKTNQKVIESFFPSLIPGQSIVFQQDYGNPWNPWVAVTMAYFADNLEPLVEEATSRLFHYRQAIDFSRLPADLAQALPAAEKIRLLESTYPKLTPRTRALHEGGAMAILKFMEYGEAAGLMHIDSYLEQHGPALPPDLLEFLRKVRYTIDVWNYGWAYAREMETKF